MMILRIGSQKQLGKITDHIELSVNNTKYILTEDVTKELRIHKSGGEALLVQPCYKNEILVK